MMQFPLPPRPWGHSPDRPNGSAWLSVGFVSCTEALLIAKDSNDNHGSIIAIWLLPLATAEQIHLHVETVRKWLANEDWELPQCSLWSDIVESVAVWLDQQGHELGTPR